MAEFTAVAEQTVEFGAPVIFTETTVRSQSGLVRHQDGTGLFNLVGFNDGNGCGCCCCQNNETDYHVAFHANIAVPDGGTVGEISLAVAVGGAVIPATLMAVTPTAAVAYFNVGTDGITPVWDDCCQNLSIVNTSATAAPILVRNARLAINLP